MKRLSGVIFMVCAVLALPDVAVAQAQKGDREIQVSGNMFSILTGDGVTSAFGQVSFGIGFFLTDRFELAVAPSVNIQAIRNPGRPGTPAVRFGNVVVVPAQPPVPPSTEWDVDSGFGTKAQFFFGATAAMVKPYVGGVFQIQSFKVEEGASFGDNTYSGGLFGVKSYLSENTALDFNGQLGFQTTHPEVQLLSFNVGITYIF